MPEPAEPIRIDIPERSLVVLAGIPASGKSTLATRLFAANEVVSSDVCRCMICDALHDQRASKDAYMLMRRIIGLRMKFDRFVVADATHLKPRSRARLIDLALAHDYPSYLILLDVPSDECKRRDSRREERAVGHAVIEKFTDRVPRDIDALRSEGFADAWVLTPDQIADLQVHREGRASPDEPTCERCPTP